MSEIKKAFVITPPAFGHINPMSSVVYELKKKTNFKFIFYGNAENREAIERCGAEFRLYPSNDLDFKTENVENIKENRVGPALAGFFIDCAHEILPVLLEDFEKERPELILYDQVFFPGKYLIDLIKRRKDIKQPKMVMFHPSFAFNKEMEKYYSERLNRNFWFLIDMLWLFFKQIMFNIRFGTRIIHPLQMWLDHSEHLNIVAVFPKFQLGYEKFDSTYKFVGPCISEQVRNYDVKDARLKSILDNFKPVDRTVDNPEPPNSELKLIYVSLGTFFNDNINVFDKIITGFKTFDQKNRSLSSKQFRIVLSVGDKVFEKLTKKVEEEKYEIPDNILFYAKVPQIEILKRASLFVTHSGQNSASEAIQYGVPVICVPIVGDQPIVARRMCEDLKLGIHLDTKTFTPLEFSDAVDQVFTSETFLKNILEMCRTSQQYKGVETSVKLISDLINESESSSKKSN